MTSEQEAQFRTFGFVVLRDVFTHEELRTVRAEFDRAAKRASGFEPFDGTKMHYFNMLGSQTPFYASLPEDPRFYEVAEQLFGEKTFGFESNAYRYVGNTRWHYNDGSSNIHGYGIKFQFPLQPVAGNSGSLRFIPGSHKKAFQDRLVRLPPLGRTWYGTQRAWDEIDEVPCHVCDYAPGDVVAFDLRIFHATWGGNNDRQMSCVSFFHYPETAEEVETMRNIVPGYLTPKLDPATPWNDGVREQWLSTLGGNPKRESWIDRLKELSEIPQSQTGLRLVFNEYGMSTPVPVGVD